jgi:hypothetical protein
MQAVQYVISASFVMQPHAKEVFEGAENGGFYVFSFLEHLYNCVRQPLT